MSQPLGLGDLPAVHQHPHDHSGTCSLCCSSDSPFSYHVACGHHSCSSCINSESTTSTDDCLVCSRDVQISTVNGARDSVAGVMEELIDFDKHDDVDHEKGDVTECHDITAPVSVQNTSSTRGARSHSDLHCSQHPTEVVRMFCSECETSFCVKCFFQTHKDHAVEDVDEASGRLRDTLNDFVSQLSQQLASLSARRRVVRQGDDAIIGQLDQRINSVRIEIDRSAEQLRQSVEQVLRQRELEWETRNSKELQLQTEAMNVVEACKTLAVDGRPVDVLAEFKLLESTVRQVENKIKSSSDHGVQDHYLELVELDLGKFLPRGRRNLIGEIVHSHQEVNNLGKQTSYEELENELKREKEQNDGKCHLVSS